MTFFVFKHKTAYEMRISDWSSDVCSSDLNRTRSCYLDLSVIQIDCARGEISTDNIACQNTNAIKTRCGNGRVIDINYTVANPIDSTYSGHTIGAFVRLSRIGIALDENNATIDRRDPTLVCPDGVSDLPGCCDIHVIRDR